MVDLDGFVAALDRHVTKRHFLVLSDDGDLEAPARNAAGTNGLGNVSRCVRENGLARAARMARNFHRFKILVVAYESLKSGFNPGCTGWNRAVLCRGG